MTLREELIQVAAVAVAMVQDLDEGSTSEIGNIRILRDVFHERIRQEKKWGPQTHSEHDWMMILMEEVGEAAEEVDHGSSLLGVIVNTGRGAKRYLTQKFGT